MAMQCEVCGNSYDKAFRIVLSNGEAHAFDSFEYVPCRGSRPCVATAIAA